MQAHVENAQAVAEWLEGDKRVEFVNYAGLTSHPHHERAAKYLPKGPGSCSASG
jgi:O-acetylhomoserine (thiol)-lyase